MKKYGVPFLVLTFMAVTAFKSNAQTVSRSVSGYTGIDCNGPFNIAIKIDGTEGVKLDVDADILDDVKTEVENGILKIGFKSRWKNHHNVKHANIYISAKSLNYLTSGGSGSVTLDGVVTGEHAKVALSGSGDIKAAVRSGTLDLSISGSGNININGSAAQADIQISGSGNIDGRSLKTDVADARISGSGNIKVIANKTVSARISGSGGVQYWGNASIAETHYSGSGRVNKAD